MPWIKLALLASCLLGPPLLACSQTEPPSKDFVLVDQRPDKAKENGNSLEKAQRVCTEETKHKGTSSLLGIFTRLRKGSAEEDYIACMKARGYEVVP